MVQQEIVQRKLAELERRVLRVQAHRRASPDELAADRDALDLVAFNLMLSVQAACDPAPARQARAAVRADLGTA